MGIFRQNFDRPGPGVAKDAPRKKGAARFFEILGRDAGSLFKAGLLVGLAYIPVGIFVGFGLFSLSMPVTLLAAGVGGLLTGPLLAGLYDTVMRALRDEPGYWWHTYKRAMKANWKQAMLAGVVLNLLVGAQVLLEQRKSFVGDAPRDHDIPSHRSVAFILTGLERSYPKQGPLPEKTGARAAAPTVQHRPGRAASPGCVGRSKVWPENRKLPLDKWGEIPYNNICCSDD